MNRRRAALVAAHAAAFLAAPYLSRWVVGPPQLAVSLGMPLAVLGYGVRDVLHEAHGKRVADSAVLVAFALRAVVWTWLWWLGAAGESLRLLVAGETQLVVSQLWLDSAIYERMKGRPFAARYNLSNVASVTLSLVVFVVVGFYGRRPVLGLIAGGLLLRLVMAAAVTVPMSRVARWASACLLLVTAARADTASGYVRALAGSGERLESNVAIRLSRLWISEQVTLDHYDQNVWQSRATVGCSVVSGLSAVVQRQDVTGRPAATRFGVEWRWSR